MPTEKLCQVLPIAASSVAELEQRLAPWLRYRHTPRSLRQLQRNAVPAHIHLVGRDAPCAAHAGQALVMTSGRARS